MLSANNQFPQRVTHGAYYTWLAQAEKVLGYIDLASDKEDELANLYLEGFNPEEAVVAMQRNAMQGAAMHQELNHAA